MMTTVETGLAICDLKFAIGNLLLKDTVPVIFNHKLQIANYKFISV